MISALLGLALGLGLLLGGGASLVVGASGIAARYGVSPAVVGLTILAFGTSAPELVVNILGALRGETELAFGNVVGSNLANLGLVLGAAAFIRPVEIHGQIVRREVPLLLLATAVIVVMAADPFFRGLPAAIDRSDATILCLLFGIFLYVAAQDFLRGQSSDPLLSDIDSNPLVTSTAEGSFDWLLIIFGSAALLTGGQLTISNGVAIAAWWQVPTALIGLFMVAIGTSLPELVTSIIAAIRREADLAVGNVVGSNLFNGLFVLPVSAIIRPVNVPAGGSLDLTVSLLFAAVLIPIFWFGRARMGRKAGPALLVCYLVYAMARTN